MRWLLLRSADRRYIVYDGPSSAAPRRRAGDCGIASGRTWRLTSDGAWRDSILCRAEECEMQHRQIAVLHRAVMRGRGESGGGGGGC